MDEKLKKFCYYYLNENHTNQNYNELIGLAKDEEELKTLEKKAQNLATKLQNITSQIGYGTDFESFYNILQEYLDKKDEFKEEKKKKYLKILTSLALIYDIDLKNELEEFVTSIDVKAKNEAIRRYCHYLLSQDADSEALEELHSYLQENHLNEENIKELASKHLENIYALTKKVSYNADLQSFSNLFDEYISRKKDMSELEKEYYLRILYHLSKIYKIDLRAKLETTKSQIISKQEIAKELTNPLENNSLLKAMLYQRYNNGNFCIKELSLPQDHYPKENDENYNPQEELASLLIKLYAIFLDKLNNYAHDDINHHFINILTEEEQQTLKNINEQDLLNFLKAQAEHQTKEKIIQELNISSSLYTFIKESISTILNSYQSSSMFKVEDNSSTIAIYLNTSNCKETYLFLSSYIKECVMNNIHYQFQLLNDFNHYNKEQLILYANYTDFFEKIKILNLLNDKNLAWIKTFGTPIHSGAKYENSYYSLSFIGLKDSAQNLYLPYNDYFDLLSEVAYYRVLAKLIITKIKEQKNIEIINNFIDLEIIERNNSEWIPTNLLYNGVPFLQIKDIINKYLAEVSNSLNKYMEEEDKTKILITEFQKSLRYLINKIEKQPKKAINNIALNKEFETYLKS